MGTVIDRKEYIFHVIIAWKDDLNLDAKTQMPNFDCVVATFVFEDINKLHVIRLVNRLSRIFSSSQIADHKIRHSNGVSRP